MKYKIIYLIVGALVLTVLSGCSGGQMSASQYLKETDDIEQTFWNDANNIVSILYRNRDGDNIYHTAGDVAEFGIKMTKLKDRTNKISPPSEYESDKTHIINMLDKSINFSKDMLEGIKKENKATRDQALNQLTDATDILSQTEAIKEYHNK